MTRLANLEPRARSSAEEHYLDMVGVTGSIPVAPTIKINYLTSRHVVLFRFIEPRSSNSSAAAASFR